MKLPITPKQLDLINASQRALRAATADAQLILDTIVAGLQDLPEGAKLVKVTQDPPQLVFDVPETAEAASKPKKVKRG